MRAYCSEAISPSDAAAMQHRRYSSACLTGELPAAVPNWTSPLIDISC